MDRSAKVVRQPQTLFKILLSQPQPAATYRGTVYAAVGLDSNISSFVASCLTIDGGVLRLWKEPNIPTIPLSLVLHHKLSFVLLLPIFLYLYLFSSTVH